MKSEGPSNFLCPGLNPLRSSLYPRGHWHSWHHYAPIWCHLHKTRHIRGEYQLLTSAKRNQEMALWVRGEQKPEPCWLLIRRRWPGFHRQTRRRKNNQAHSGEWSWRQEHTITNGGQAERAVFKIRDSTHTRNTGLQNKSFSKKNKLTSFIVSWALQPLWLKTNIDFNVSFGKLA